MRPIIFVLVLVVVGLGCTQPFPTPTPVPEPKPSPIVPPTQSPTAELEPTPSPSGSDGPPRPDFTITALSESSATWPVGTDEEGFVSQSDDPVAPWSGTSVQFRGTDQGGSTETLGLASLVYRYRLEFNQVAELTSISPAGAAFNGPDSILRVLDENMNVLGTWETFGGNRFETHTVEIPSVQGTVFFIEEFDSSTNWRYREIITVDAVIPLSRPLGAQAERYEVSLEAGKSLR